MGLILPQEVSVKTSNATVNYYKDLGYDIPTHIGKTGKEVFIEGASFNVNVLDLMQCSEKKVKIQCDVCGKIIETSYSVYNQYQYNGEYTCHKCISKSNKQADKLKNNYAKLTPILIAELTDYINMNGYPTSIRDTFHSKNKMHSYKSYINCFGGNIINWIEACGIKLTDNEKKKLVVNKISKEDAITIIYKMSEELNRPLKYDDFRSPSEYNYFLSINRIKKLWGTFNNMKKELGLKVIRESMTDKQLSKEETIEQILNICNYIKSQNRDFTTTREIDSLSSTVTSDTLRRMVKKYFNLSLPKYFEKFDVRLGKEGSGIVFDFDDGEHTTSQFEYMFSKYLKDYGLTYNKDYFRDVKYKTFIDNYNGNMNCDYVIKINNKTIYIEIAGIIAEYKNWHYQNREITRSKSKEKYRLKLKEKERMFKDNNLIYFILFPCDLTRDIFMQIINDGSLELKHNIEKFMKNNIDWVKIQDIGELKYKENEISCYGQLVVDYKNSNSIK